MNALICVGCDHYDTAGNLTGAEADAKAVFELLTSANDPYNSAHAILLPSPTLPDLRKALNDIFPLKTGIEGLTFFFAGHGGTVGGNFYLCVRDTQIDRLSTTAFPITQLFSIINEFQPPQVNIVVDACAAGGSSFDLGNLIKPEITGSSASSSVAFLGACGADQDAAEEGGHGVLTRELMRCLKGEIEVQRRAPLLDLVEVGAVVSPLVQSAHNSQRPLSWGLSLFGGSSFAKNPFYTPTGSGQHFPLPNISPFSSLGAKIREGSSELWEIHRNLPHEFSPRRLMRSLAPILKEAADAQERAALIEGISSSLSARAVESEDLLAPALCHSTCLVSLLPYIEDKVTQARLASGMQQLLDRNAAFRETIFKSLETDPNYLLSKYGIGGDLFYLPLRISKLLGWIGADIIAQLQLPILVQDVATSRKLAEVLISRYVGSLVAVSDAQAAPLYVFLTACKIHGWADLAQEVLTKVYASLCSRHGNITRDDCPPLQAVRYILSLTNSALTPLDWRPANPNHLLPVLLIGGTEFGLADVWSLRDLDRLPISFFLPENPRHFSEEHIENGKNHTYRIGDGIWKISEFFSAYQTPIQDALSKPTFALPPTGQVQCVLSSLLFPDRIPFFVGETIFRSAV